MKLTIWMHHLLNLSVPVQGPGTVPLSTVDGASAPEDEFAIQQATQFFDHLALQAAHAGVAVDILAAGLVAVNVQMLAPVAHQTGGALMVHAGVLCFTTVVCPDWWGTRLHAGVLCLACLGMQLLVAGILCPVELATAPV